MDNSTKNKKRELNLVIKITDNLLVSRYYTLSQKIILKLILYLNFNSFSCNKPIKKIINDNFISKCEPLKQSLKVINIKDCWISDGQANEMLMNYNLEHILILSI